MIVDILILGIFRARYSDLIYGTISIRYAIGEYGSTKFGPVQQLVALLQYVIWVWVAWIANKNG